jgi:DNA polymerase III alpha subunit
LLQPLFLSAGVNFPEEIIATAAEQQMTAVALTDTNGTYAAVPFYEKAKAASVKPIVGVALDVAVEAENEKQRKTKHEIRRACRWCCRRQMPRDTAIYAS